MQVQLTMEGGIAHFPGLSRPVVIDSAALSDEEVGELQRLVAAARFFEQPPSAGPPPRGAADYRRYTLVVADGERRHSVQVTDPVADQGLRELLRFVETKARALRRQGQGGGSEPHSEAP
jgi:hypothetical protein